MKLVRVRQIATAIASEPSVWSHSVVERQANRVIDRVPRSLFNRNELNRYVVQDDGRYAKLIGLQTQIAPPAILQIPSKQRSHQLRRLVQLPCSCSSATAKLKMKIKGSNGWNSHSSQTAPITARSIHHQTTNADTKSALTCRWIDRNTLCGKEMRDYFFDLRILCRDMSRSGLRRMPSRFRTEPLMDHQLHITSSSVRLVKPNCAKPSWKSKWDRLLQIVAFKVDVATRNRIFLGLGTGTIDPTTNELKDYGYHMCHEELRGWPHLMQAIKSRFGQSTVHGIYSVVLRQAGNTSSVVWQSEDFLTHYQRAQQAS
jgi:hypothetical protein